MTPVTGVISIHSTNYEWGEEICPTCEAIEKEIMECDTCPECGGDLIQIRPDYIECEECLEEYDMDGNLEMLECFDHEKLIGDWKKSEGLYQPNEDGEFAAIVTDSTFNCIQVVWSKYTKNVRVWCSLCFPNQADLDSGDGNIEAYCLPDELLLKNEE